MMPAVEPDWSLRRQQMLDEQLIPRGIRDPRVLAAMGAVPREEFCEEASRELAYADCPVPIGVRQTISQPYIVAVMATLLDLHSGDRLLDIGTGSGYAAAVFSLLCAQVLGVELVPELAQSAALRLKQLGYSNVEVRQGDGRLGWPERGPYDAIAVAAASEDVPPALLDQLAQGGRLLIPLGPPGGQSLCLFIRDGDAYARQELGKVAFIPLLSP